MKASGRNFRCEDQVVLNRHAQKLAWDVVRDSYIICCTASAAGNGTLCSVSCHVSSGCCYQIVAAESSANFLPDTHDCFPFGKTQRILLKLIT